ncbi:poly(ADP-ribose) glycohydrolase-like isoform X2 [Convolutriloba macropyga]|uniref:poly(ADP-ribose) glycohydrolase-like isoform X2 n=1 Tax=Convolutriloba macropyga TaxID=536237 RepID=UPI003F51E2E6
MVVEYPVMNKCNVIQNTDSEQKTSSNEIDMTSENGEGSQNIPETLESPIEAEEKVEDMTNNGDHTCSDATIVSCSAAHEEINSSNSFTGGCPFENLFTCPEETPHDFNKPSHKILLDVDALAQGIAVPYPKNLVDKWTQGHVRVPCVSKCLLRVPNPTPNARPAFVFSKKSHWSEVKEQLNETIYTVDDLISAINHYNPGFSRVAGSGMRSFFTNYLPVEERAKFFSVTLPKLQALALELPQLVTQPIPWLNQNTNMSLTLSKRQVASLNANLFLNTFPVQDGTGDLPRHHDMLTLFSSKRANRVNSNFEKVRCLLNYFHRVTDSTNCEMSSGTVSFHRRCLDLDQARPQWEKVDKHLSQCTVKSKGFIENQQEMLQVDFANQYIGGGVLGEGCVQEEIRFVTHPELFVSLLFTPRLLENECLIIQGAERYCDYVGYSDSFKFLSDYCDPSPSDSIGRKLVTLVAIDALVLRSQEAKAQQFKLQKILRELNKAYIGFRSCSHTDNASLPVENASKLTAVATGNWGCGAFGGNPELKFLIQWMAASYAGRDVLYLTFSDQNLAKRLSKIVNSLLKKPYSVSEVWRLICLYSKSDRTKSLCEFLVN